MWRELFLEKYKNFFKADFLFVLSSHLKYKKFFKLEARKFHFSKYKKLLKSGSFYFSRSERYFLKYQKVSLPNYIKNFFGVSVSRNIRKAFFWGNIRSFLILGSKRSTFQEYKKFSQGGTFFIFWAWA